MNYGPKNFDLRGNGLYVIIEIQNDVIFSDNSYKIVGIFRSFENAKNYLGPNRFIKGPFSISDDIIPPSYPKIIDPQISYPNPNTSIYPKFPSINGLDRTNHSDLSNNFYPKNSLFKSNNHNFDDMDLY